MENKSSISLKYKIREVLENKSVIDYKLLNRAIPKRLGVSYSTFWDWQRIPVDSKKDIGYQNLKIIAGMLGVNIEDLENGNE